MPNRGKRSSDSYDDYDDSDYDDSDSEKAVKNLELKPTFPMDRGNASSTVTGDKIVGGEEAIRNSLPWQISLREKSASKSFCGGSIISSDRILTAAHCVMKKPRKRRDSLHPGCYFVKDLEIYAGTHTKGGRNPQTDKFKQARNVRSFCISPLWEDDYDNKGIYGDAAILILQTRLELNNQVATICLPAPETILPDQTYWQGSSIA